MIKNSYISAFVAVAALAAVCSCTKEIAQSGLDPESGVSEVTISATISEALTKVAFTPAYDASSKPESMSLAWAEGDAIRVYNHADRSLYDDFTLDAASIGKTSGVFTGTPSNILSASAYDVEVIGGAGFNYAAQAQPSDGAAGSLKYLASKANVADYSSITFDSISSVLAITAKMPSTAVAATIKSVDITASGNIFAGGNSLSVTFGSIGDAGEDGILHFFATLPEGSQTIAAGTTLLVHFNAPGEDHDVYTRFITMGAQEFTSARLNTININAENSASHAGTADCDGTTEAKAYLLGDKYQMQAMRSLMVAGEKRYFKMVDDIDLDGVDWKSLNGADPFDKQIWFDGCGHTISNFYTTATSEYPSFCGVLYGTCKNVNFINAYIHTAVSGVGIVGGYGGTTEKPGIAENIHVQGTVEGAGTTGGMFGTVRECTISRCSADVTITSKGQNVGGIFGMDKGGAVTVSNCWTAGTIDNAYSICGGIGGNVSISGSSITNCFSTMTVKTQFYLGGILGRANGGAKGTAANCDGKNNGFTMVKCIAWNDAVTSVCEDGNEHYSSGPVIGCVGTNNTLTDCVRKYDFAFTDCPRNTALGAAYAPFDQENASSSVALVKSSGQYAYAYHGKATGETETLSDVAVRLGWSAEIWDFSAAVPTLR